MAATFTLDTSVLSGSDVLGGTTLTLTNAFPTLIVEIGFSNNALDEPVTWVDVTQYVVNAQVTRGRQHELNRFEAGTANVTLTNRDGRFSPFNASGAYSPNILPFKPIRIRAKWNGQVYPVFRGFIESWPIKWEDAANSDVTIQCVDATKVLNLKKATNLNATYPSLVTTLSPYLYYRFGDAPGSSQALDASGNNRPGTVLSFGPSKPTGGLAWTYGASGAVVGDTDPAIELGANDALVYRDNISVDASNFTFECFIKARQNGTTIFYLEDVTSTRSLALLVGTDGKLFFTASDTVPNQINLQGAKSINDGNWHHVVVTVQTANLGGIYVDGVLDISGSASPGAVSLTGMVRLAIGGTNSGPGARSPASDAQIDEAALYPVVVSQAMLNHYVNANFPRNAEASGIRIAAYLSALSWPSTLQYIDTGQSTVQAAGTECVTQAGLANIQAAADTEGGALFIGCDGSVLFYDRNHTSKPPFNTPSVVLGDSGVLGTEEPYELSTVDIEFDDLDLYNQVVVTPNGLAPQITNDSASQTLYGIRSLSLSGTQYSTADALGQAQFNLGIYKNPLQRVRAVSFTPYSDPDILYKAALGFELLTRVKLVRRPLDGASSTFSQEALIEGVAHDIAPDRWRTTWRLSPTAALGKFVLDQSTLSGADLLGW